ncbi:hypothetical protein JQ596_06780 [Bradyrhizobium manausense]|uniref:hypothetical protein n=1 Tax=Bradyrhizobium TaxID=374 RepID=UPI001BAC3279|nr:MULTISPECIES: hypothetical protein [Bradyrhizobium]MBR0825233.1 hypothetical protein [Bradyrhizobium manausense]UVO33594.1 hypothetical protein KUF59_39190 [Bradyrhizobium arachidis]
MARTTRVPYLVTGTNEHGSANLGRVSASVALRLARKLLREGYMDVRICTPRGRVLQSDELDELEPPQETDVMAKGQQRSNREAKKPKKEKAKVITAAPSRKEAAWQPDFGPAKKK